MDVKYKAEENIKLFFEFPFGILIGKPPDFTFYARWFDFSRALVARSF